MIKKLLYSFALLAISAPCFAQWTTTGNNTIHTNSGNVGIGISNPQDNLDVNGHLSLSGGAREIHFRDADGLIKQDVWLTNSNAIGLGPGAENNSLFVTSNGNVGVGTLDPKGYKLAVAGNLISESVTVKLQSQWPDYVFKSNYMLPSLSTVKAYIDKNKHLPDMPSEAEVAKDGVNLGEMNKLLLKKVEELTLHMIRQQEEIDQLKRRKKPAKR